MVTLIYHDLSDLGSLILIQIIPKERALSAGRIILLVKNYLMTHWQVCSQIKITHKRCVEQFNPTLG